jgi:hypothetical protein
MYGKDLGKQRTPYRSSELWRLSLMSEKECEKKYEKLLGLPSREMRPTDATTTTTMTTTTTPTTQSDDVL